MGGINVGRWIAGGVAAGAVIWVLEGVGAFFYMDQMTTALQAHGLSMEMSAGVWALTVVVSLLIGLTLMFFYAAARPRFGPGVRTALKVAVALWLGSYVVSILGLAMLDLYPSSMLWTWGAWGLVEIAAAAIVGGWIYREYMT